MKCNSVEKRLKQLEEMIAGEPVIVLVSDPSGSEREMSIDAFAERWKADGLSFVRIVRGYDPTGRDIDVILSTWEVIANMDRGLL